MRLRAVLSHCTVRPFRRRDAASLAANANNRKIWLNLRDRFPHPYSLRHAEEFLKTVVAARNATHWAIDVDGLAVGAIGIRLLDDVERVSAEIGYWLGEPYWGRGISTEALRAVTAHAIRAFKLTRVFALPFAHNAASCRVLAKAGYAREARLRGSAIKDGKLADQILYGFVTATRGVVVRAPITSRSRRSRPRRRARR